MSKIRYFSVTFCFEDGVLVDPQPPPSESMLPRVGDVITMNSTPYVRVQTVLHHYKDVGADGWEHNVLVVVNKLPGGFGVHPAISKMLV